MSLEFRYRHLYYFWVAAREGGIARAAARLGMAVQTVSAQVRELERSLGCSLLQPSGRGVALTEAGRAALAEADRIFEIGERLPQVVREAGRANAMRLTVGISDALPKLVVHRLLAPALSAPGLRLVCDEGEFEDLIAALALHRHDVVLADRPAPPNPNLKVYSHALGASELAWYVPAAHAAAAKRDFPASLAQVPVLLPTTHAAVRPALDAWFERHGLHPRVAAEVEDSALMKTLAASGLGAVAAPRWVERDLSTQYGLRRAGECDGVEERYYAIGRERKVLHPLVKRILAAAG